MSRLRFTGISGSLRVNSFSSAVLSSIATLLPSDAEFSSLDIGSLPHYNQDLDGVNPPASVVTARHQIAASDYIIIVSSEYNYGIPGVLKNALDWLSRPAFASGFAAKPVLFVTVSPSALGGVRAQAQLRETLSSMLCKLVPLPELAITFAGSKISDGALIDEPTLELVRSVLLRFIEGATPLK